MANTPTRIAPKALQPSHAESKRKIDTQTEDFLRQGGQIQQIPNGVSGQVWTPSRHIKLAKRPSEPTSTP